MKSQFSASHKILQFSFILLPHRNKNVFLEANLDFTSTKSVNINWSCARIRRPHFYSLKTHKSKCELVWL